MRVGIKSYHWEDAEGRPEGGVTLGTGFTISWQHGPLGRGAVRQEPNGAFVEDVIAAAVDRLRYYQQSRFACAENEQVLNFLEAALEVLGQRTREREARQVEGTHTP